MIEGVKAITIQNRYDHKFSICSIITNREEYALMRNSFIANGFEAEYLVAENIDANKFDAYTALNCFLQQAKGEYIIVVHQDVRCIESAANLEKILSDLNVKDPRWAVCGNAGASGYKKMFYYLNDNGRERLDKNLPARVYSLDENLLIIKKSANLTVSADVNSFHFYGTDVCIIADLLGYSCYVVPFLVKHLSSGNLSALFKEKPFFVRKYGNKLRSRFIQTTCTKFYIGSSPWQTVFFNNPIIFFFVKMLQRVKGIFV